MKQKTVVKVRTRRMKVEKLLATIVKRLPWWLRSGKDIFSTNRNVFCSIEHVRGKRFGLFIWPEEGSSLFSLKERKRLMNRIAEKIRSIGLVIEERLAFGSGIHCFCRYAPG